MGPASLIWPAEELGFPEGAGKSWNSSLLAEKLDFLLAQNLSRERVGFWKELI